MTVSEREEIRAEIDILERIAASKREAGYALVDEANAISAYAAALERQLAEIKEAKGG